MWKTPFPFTGVMFASMCVVLILYIGFGEKTKFFLVGLPAPGISHHEHRLWECILLWGVLCSGVVWVTAALKRPAHATLYKWPVVLVPACIGVALTGIRVWRLLNEGDSLTSGLHSTNLHTILRTITIVMPLLSGALVSGLILFQNAVFSHVPQPGVCHRCQYNLTGNVTGICPECGEPTRTIRDPATSTEDPYRSCVERCNSR